VPARANIVVDTDGVGFFEDTWAGGELSLGREVVLQLGLGMPRCLMVDQPQAEVPAGPPALKALGAAHGTLLGVKHT
jgi:hypothetical protein